MLIYFYWMGACSVTIGRRVFVFVGLVTSVVFDMLILTSLLLGCLVYSFLVSMIWSVIEMRRKPTEYEKWLQSFSGASVVNP